MISIEQIKAARMLVGWGQAELAKAAKISLPALGNLERGAVTPRTRTIESIRKALEQAGIEFIDGPGVRRQHEILKVELIEGPDAVQKLFEDFYNTLKKDGGELLVRNVSDAVFVGSKAREPLVDYLRKVHRHRKIRARLLICEGDTYLFGKPETTLYRWVERERFGLVPDYIYKDKYAVLLWGAPLRAIITRNASLAETHRRQFEADWKKAKPLPKNLPYRWPED